MLHDNQGARKKIVSYEQPGAHWHNKISQEQG